MFEFLKKVFRSWGGTSAGGEPSQTAAAGRRRAEAGLQQGEEQFGQLVSGVRDYAIFRLDAEGRVVTWNAGAEQIKGYTAEEIIGHHFSRFYPAEVVARGWPAEELQRAAAEGRIEDEGWRVRKDGSRFWANVVITALRDEAGALRGFLKITRDLTERKRAEESARSLLREETARQAAETSAREAEQAREEERRQREQLHVTLSSIGDAVIVTDRNGLVTFMNPVAVALTGWEPHEAAGQPLERVFRIVNEETRQPVENPASKVLREGVVVGLANHTVLIARDGREIPIDDSGAPIQGQGEEIAGVVLVFRDVTESRRAVEARLHLAAIVESSDDAIISKDLGGIITSWNRGAERLYGYTAREIVGKPLSLIVPADHPDELPALMERIERGERIEHFETVRVRKDGSRVNVSLTISPVRNADGKVVGASKIARDITARKKQEAALRFVAEASKLLGELLDVPSTLQKVARLAVPQFADWCAVDMLEADGSLRRLAVAHVDPSKVELVSEFHRRHPPDPASQRGVWHVLRTGRSEMVSEVTHELLATGVKEAEYLRALRELGLRSYLGVPLTVRGKALGVVSFVTAESGRRYGAADLAVAEDLAHRAAAAVENARLYQAVREADQKKDEFLAMLAHELRNPLAPIRNGLQILKMRGDPDTVERARGMMERQVTHLVRMVDDLMDVSRIVRGKVDIQRVPVDLATVVGRATETAQPAIDAAGHQLVVSLPDEPTWVSGDVVRLTQVLSNLLVNACKYSDRAGQITVAVRREGPEAVIRVKDTGVGIAPEHLARIFDLFAQVDRSVDRSQGGLGVGLTLVKRLVEMHGGTVEARSEGVGKGSEFVVRLPALAGHGVKLEGGVNGPGLARGRRRVLIVDDNVDAAESLAILLRLAGHEVRTAYDGPTGLEIAQSFQPDLILSDIGLPGMTGYEIARRLRARPEFRNTVLSAMSGWGQEEDRRRSREAGFDYHFVKPVDPADLERLLTDQRMEASPGPV